MTNRYPKRNVKKIQRYSEETFLAGSGFVGCDHYDHSYDRGQGVLHETTNQYVEEKFETGLEQYMEIQKVTKCLPEEIEDEILASGISAYNRIKDDLKFIAPDTENEEENREMKCNLEIDNREFSDYEDTDISDADMYDDEDDEDDENSDLETSTMRTCVCCEEKYDEDYEWFDAFHKLKKYNICHDDVFICQDCVSDGAWQEWDELANEKIENHFRTNFTTILKNIQKK